MERKILYRDKSKQIIAGVCSGMAEYFSVDVVLIRLIWLLLAFSGIGIIAYIIAAVIIPAHNSTGNGQDEVTNIDLMPKQKHIGIILVVFGTILILAQFNVFSYIYDFSLSWKMMWGVLLILVGLITLVRNLNPNDEKLELVAPGKRFRRSKENKMFFGVCAGISEYLKLDVSLVRILWVVATLASHGLGIVAYFIFVVVFPMYYLEDNKPPAEVRQS